MHGFLVPDFEYGVLGWPFAKSTTVRLPSARLAAAAQALSCLAPGTAH